MVDVRRAALAVAVLGVFTPLWAQKDFGPWSTFAGGGYGTLGSDGVRGGREAFYVSVQRLE